MLRIRLQQLNGRDLICANQASLIAWREIGRKGSFANTKRNHAPMNTHLDCSNINNASLHWSFEPLFAYSIEHEERKKIAVDDSKKTKWFH